MLGFYTHDEETLGKLASLFFFGLVATAVVHNVLVVPGIDFGPFESPDSVHWNASNWWGYASRTGFWALWGLFLASLLYLFASDRLFPRWATAMAALAVTTLPSFADFSQFARSRPQVVLAPESLTLHMPAPTINQDEFTRVFRWRDVRRIKFEEVGSGGRFGNFVHVNLVVSAEHDFHFEVPLQVRPDTPECKAAWEKALAKFAPHVDLSL